MATKKDKQRATKKSAKNRTAPSKVVLPPFGLAEEILGVQSGNNAEMKRTEPASQKPEMERARNAEGELHLVTFNLDKEEFGVEIGNVQEIIRVGQVTAVPNSPEFIQGVINLRGRVIPVLNLRKRLNLPEGTLTKNSRIMIVECGKKVLGMLVDSVSQVIRIPEASVDEPPGEVDRARGYVKGIGKVDSRLIMLMDLDKTLAKDAQLAQAVAG